MKSCYLVDTHVHLDMTPLDREITEVVRRAREADVLQMITIGVDEKSSRRAVEIASTHENIFAAVGVHPHDAGNSHAPGLERLRIVAEENRDRVVAWGEAGLDYAKEYSPRAAQKDIFSLQIGIACELGLPLVIHARDANEDVLDMLESELMPGCTGVFHCFSGDTSVARRVLDMGFYISLTGVITFKNAHATRDVVKYVPSERLLVETDSPFLSPVPFRGRPNEPARVSLVADEVARVRGIDRQEAFCCTTQNARDLFGLPAL